MKDTWRHYLRRVVAGCIVSGSVAASSAMCYAVQLAYDTASDPVYADGWQAGDNGGTSFTPWNFDGTYSPALHEIDDGLHAGTANSSTFNNIGQSWRLAHTGGLPRAGRGFSPLQTGQTLHIVVDNPTVRQFFKGYIIRFSTGGGNICYAGAPCTPGTTPKERLGFYAFEYFTYGNWLLSDAADDNAPTTLFDVDTAAAGMQIDLTITGPETYELTADPLPLGPGGAAAPYTHSGSLGHAGTGAIDWLEFVFFNKPTSTTSATDFYIRSMEITGPAPPGVLGDYNNNGQVDAADYVLWRNGGPLQNDPTPGVQAADYDFWRAHFGNTSGAGSGVIASAVPESSTFVFLVAALGMVAAISRGKRIHTIDD